MSFTDSLRRRVVGGLVRYLKLGRVTVTNFEEKDGIRPNRDDLSFQKLYAKDVWVYAGIYAIASAAAGVPLKVMRRLSDGSSEEVPNHPFMELLANPNDFMTEYDLIELAFIYLESSGNNYWLFDDGAAEGRAPGQAMTLSDIRELWPIPPDLIVVKPGKDELIKGYEYRPYRSDKGTKLSVAEVFHCRYGTPLSLYQGQGSVEPAKKAIIGDMYAQEYNNNAFLNGALPPAFLKTDRSLTKEQRDEVKAQWAQMYQGVKNAHKLALLEAGLDIAEHKRSTARDMEYVEGSKANRTKILAALGVPPIFVGSEDAKYDNAEQQKAIFWENTMLPKFRKFQTMLTKKLHLLGEPPEIFVAFDTSDIKALQDNYAVQAATAKIWWEMGYPLNDLIKVFGPANMEAVEDGDVGFVPTSVIPLEDAVQAQDQIEPEGTQDGAPLPGDASDQPNADDAAGQKDMKAADKKIDDAHWRKFMALNEPGFRKLRAELKRFFKDQRRRIVSNITQHYRKDVKAQADIYLLNVHDETGVLSKRTKATIRSIFERAGRAVVAESGVGIAFDVSSPRAVKFLERRVFNFSFEVNKTTQDILRAKISQAISDGLTQKELTDQIGEVFDGFERYRSARIARTETGIAGNAGIQEGYTQAGVEGKRWIATRDNKVRDSHAIADGQEVDVNDPFEVGGTLLMQPGDPDGPPEEIINCRCTTRGIFKRSSEE